MFDLEALAQSKVAYSGLFPSKDWQGHDLPAPRSTMAGKRLAGGPFCLTELRRDV